MRHTYRVEGMHCGSCVAQVTSALERVTGVKSAAVSLQPPTAEVDMQDHVPLTKLNESLQKVGNYRVADMHADAQASGSDTAAASQESLYPLFLIVGYILGTVLLIALLTGEWSPHVLMRYFMGGFFLVFSFFKMLDLRGFADTYRTYDIVAGAVPAWGWVYPFAELGLGAAYVLNLAPVATNLITLLLMLVGAVGVFNALLNKRAIRCACLGTVLNLPMTKITLVEDLGMAAMAAIMLLLLW